MNQNDDGGPAFPAGDFAGGANYNGMSLRDYFAAAALSVYSIDKEESKMIAFGAVPNHAAVAEFCYGIADAMLKEREK